MPSGIYERSNNHNKKISEALTGKKKPAVRRQYKSTKPDKYDFDPNTAHGELINRGKKSYYEYLKEEKEKHDSLKTTSLRKSRWVDKI